MFEWIAVGVELPDAGVLVLLWVPDEDSREVFLGFRVGSEWITFDRYPLPAGAVTHWGHLPDPPQA